MNAAQEGARGPRAAAEKYVDLLNRGRYHDIVSLFSEDAEFYAPSGGLIQGRDAIARAYPQAIAKLSPSNVAIINTVEEGRSCAAELRATYVSADGSSSYTRDGFDLFTLGEDGLIVRLAVYAKVNSHPVGR